MPVRDLLVGQYLDLSLGAHLKNAPGMGVGDEQVALVVDRQTLGALERGALNESAHLTGGCHGPDGSGVTVADVVVPVGMKNGIVGKLEGWRVQ